MVAGLIPMLDEEGNVPRGTWETFLVKFTKQHSTSRRLKFRTGNKIFAINHYAGEVTYDPSLFIVKNKDTLSSDLLEAVSASTTPFIRSLFNSSDNGDSAGAAQATQKITVGSNFRHQLDLLIQTLNSTQPRYTFWLLKYFDNVFAGIFAVSNRILRNELSCLTRR